MDNSKKVSELERTTGMSESDILYVVTGTNPTPDAIGSGYGMTRRDFLSELKLSLATVAQGRLGFSNISTVPVADIITPNTQTLYYTKYKGNMVGIYDGTDWKLRPINNVALVISATNPNKNYDVYAYWTGAAVALEIVEWTSDTVRALNLALQDGIYVKWDNSTRRYLGTFRTTGAYFSEDSEAKRFVWNYYNQVERTLYKTDGTSHAYNLAVERQWNADTNQKMEFVLGMPTAINTNILASTTTTTGLSTRVALGIDSITASNRHLGVSGLSMAPGSILTGDGGCMMLDAGYHYLSILENASTSGTNTFAVFYAKANFLG